jgi:type I restriction enzyme R subunit
MAIRAPRDSEWATRKTLIDKCLRGAGWRITPFDPRKTLESWDRCAVEEYQTGNGPADYALILGDRVVGVVEAKKLTLGPQNVLVQAERYAGGLIQDGFGWGSFGVPFLYSTNGEVIWYEDVRDERYRSRQLAGFHTPDALAEFLGRDASGACARALAMPQTNVRLRDYQGDASRAIEEALAERKRQMLVAMATGTGKTFTMVNEIYRLMKTGVAKRISFLVDRRALAAQAVRAFSSFDAGQGLKFDQVYELYSQRFQKEDLEETFDSKVLPKSYLTEPKAGSAFVYVSTIQRMAINLFGRNAIFGLGDEAIDDDAEQLEIPIHAFDLIIADECHRGYTSSEVAMWRKTLDHFDAVKIGLTATPAKHTTAYFKDVVYRYEYERAVKEGHLVDYDVVTIKSNVRMNGVFLKEGEQVGVVDTESGAQKMDVLEDERSFDTTSLEREITAPESNKKILEEVYKHAVAHEQQTGRFPKILIFAANDLPHTSHADQLVNLARDIFGRGDAFVQKITGSPTVDRPLQHIRKFRNRPEPGVVVTVDMLSTGVDIPDLEFIVFLRPVKSRILFEQMLGRGTRKGERYPDKSHFVVFDCFDGTLLAYFKNATGISEEVPAPPTKSITEIIDSIWSNRDRAYHTNCLVKRLQRIEKEMSGEARTAFAKYIPDGDMGRYAKELETQLQKDFTGAMALLRESSFQDLLVNYQRRERVFYVAHQAEDEVSSSWLVRGADGKEYKPDDYLVAFAQYVKDHQQDIDGIGILLDRPQEWNPNVLQDLRDKLASAPPRFTVDVLQRAHATTYKKALVDLISMVKHAANEQHPLYSAPERVEKAMSTLKATHSFGTEELQWLERIRTHLQENLSIDRDDFDNQPVFARYGGWTRANKAFKDRLTALLKEVNEGIAA